MLGVNYPLILNLNLKSEKSYSILVISNIIARMSALKTLPYSF